ncbi:MAG: hypothetical protein K6A63_08555 [Acholeplasmatales bacterium]|nr:hypothetical protein [Acholeplasmatales bacterium]
MPNLAKILIIIGVGIVVLIILLVFIYQLVSRTRINKMHKEVEELFNNLKKDRPDVVVLKEEKIDKKNLKPYDYTITTPNSVNFIKIIPNFSGDEITINNSVKWQLRRSYRDESMRFVPDIEGFMRYDMPEPVLRDDALPEEETPKKKKKESKEQNLFTMDNLSFSDLDINQESSKNEKRRFKRNRKIFVIYPGAKSLLMYINECEMQLVDNKTDVYGSRVVSFGDLKKNRDSILK